jgi:hypothetical protein
MSYLTLTLFLLPVHPTSVKNTIEFFDELLARRDCFLEVRENHSAFSPCGQSVCRSDDVLDLKQTIS